MSSASTWIVLTGLLSAIAVSAPVLLSRDDGTRLASAAEIRELVRAVSICPTLDPQISETFENSFGDPRSGDIRRMTEFARACAERQEFLPENLQKASAIAALQSSLEANTYHLPQTRTIGDLKLDFQLSDPRKN